MQVSEDDQIIFLRLGDSDKRFTVGADLAAAAELLSSPVVMIDTVVLNPVYCREPD